MNDIKITLKYDNKEIKITQPFDSNIDDWKDTFKVILTWVTFAPDTINNLFQED